MFGDFFLNLNLQQKCLTVSYPVDFQTLMFPRSDRIETSLPSSEYFFPVESLLDLGRREAESANRNMPDMMSKLAVFNSITPISVIT